MSAWATTIISGLVLVVAFMQWRTAHQKVLLDLFEKRLAIYEKIKKAVEHITRSEAVIADKLLMEAFDASAFLFGKEIQAHIDSIWTIHQTIARMNYKLQNGTLTAADDITHATVSAELIGLSGNLSELFAPYMRMNQTRVRTPIEWFYERNRIRLSYADERQK